jgi:hypothetical protein
MPGLSGQFGRDVLQARGRQGLALVAKKASRGIVAVFKAAVATDPTHGCARCIHRACGKSQFFVHFSAPISTNRSRRIGEILADNAAYRETDFFRTP